MPLWGYVSNAEYVISFAQKLEENLILIEGENIYLQLFLWYNLLELATVF